MRTTLQLFLLSVVLAFGISPAVGQSSPDSSRTQLNDWATVEALLPNSLIGIKGMNGDVLRCVFVTADEQGLTCQTQANRRSDVAPVVLPKTKVYEVTIEASPAANGLVAGAVGEVAGFALARVVTHSGFLGLLAGGLYGAKFHRGGSQLHILRGRLIYRMIGAGPSAAIAARPA
ncbi:MAG TPA: hypothetical protein VN709_07280 [Terriglobales bacterium]|nr:hypothetical protein [Terriglobales bacterium]